MNRFRKTGAYFKSEDLDGGLLSQPLMNVAAEAEAVADEYGAEDYGE
jgi:hypothetical protein